MGQFRTQSSAKSAKKEERAARKERRKEMKSMFSLRHYLVLMWVCCMIRLYVRARTRMSAAFREQKKKGAMLLLSNHLSVIDFAYFTTPFFGKKVNFVVAESMMYSTPCFATLIQGYHAITKKQFYADYTCIKNIKRNIDAGISVIMCPEGKVSAEGKTGPIAFSIAKLVKWLGCPVGSSVLKGSGLTLPKWASGIRRNRVECNLDMIMTADEVKSMSTAEILERIEGALAHNEHIWQTENGMRYRGKRLAEGLERLLYKCPVCGEDFSTATEGGRIFCRKCGFEAEYTDRGVIEPRGETAECPARIDEWFEWQKGEVEKEVADSDFVLEKPVNLLVENTKRNGYRFVTAGTLRMTRETLSFASALTRRPVKADSTYHVSAMDYRISADDTDTEPVEPEFMALSFPVRNFVTVANIPGDSLDLCDEKHTYRMMFAEDKASTKFVLAIEEINKNQHI